MPKQSRGGMRFYHAEFTLSGGEILRSAQNDKKRRARNDKKDGQNDKRAQQAVLCFPASG